MYAFYLHLLLKPYIIENYVIENFFCHIFNFILSVSYNNENKLMVTLQFPLANGTFN